MADSFFAFEGEMMQEYPHAQYHHMSSHSHSPSPTPSHHTVESSSNSSFNDEYAFVPPTTTAEEEFLHPTAHHHGQDYGLFPMMMKVKQEMMLEEAFDFTSSSNSMELDADHPPMIGQVHSNSSGSPSLAPLPTIKYEPMTSPSPLLPPSAVNSNVATATAIVTHASIVTAATPVHAVVTPSSVPSPIVMAAAVPSSSLAHQPTMAVPIARGKASPRQVLAKVLTKKENVQPVSPNAVTALSAFNSPSITSATSPAAALIFSPSVTAALPIHHNSVRSTLSISSNASASGSGGSGQNSDASDSDSSSEGGGVVGVRSSSKKNRKRKSVRTGSVGGSNSDDLTGMVEEGEDCGLAVDMTGMPLTGDKRQQRLQRNRASAQLSRERKKQYMRLLENQLKEMTDLNEGLTLQVTQLTQENATLKSRLAKLAMRERVAGRYPRPSSANGPTSAMPGLSPVSSSSLGSENDSSLPTTPMIVQQRDEESCTSHDLPQAKKLKVAAYSSPSSSSSPVNGSGSRGGFNARTGMLFFTLVMGVCLFHNLVGLDTIHQGRVHSPAVLESIDDVLPSSASIVVPTTPTSPSSTMVLAPRVGRALLATSSSPKSTTSSSREDVDAFALVPVLDSSSKAIDVASARHSEAHMMSGIDSAISAQHLNTHLLRRILVGGNLTYSDSYQYLFAPNALRITEEVWNGLLNSSASSSSSSEVPSPAAALMEDVEGTEKQVALFDRTRLQRGTKRTRIGHAIATPTKTNAQERLRAKLPLATTTATPPVTASSNAPLQVGDKLLLWLPLHAVNSDNLTNGGHGTKQAIVELSCNIAGLRPIDIE